MERIRCFLCQGYRINCGGPVGRVEQQPPDVDDGANVDGNGVPDFDAIDPLLPLDGDGDNAGGNIADDASVNSVSIGISCKAIMLIFILVVLG